MPFVLAGVGMALFFTPMANLVLSSVRREQEGQASGANNAIRELGGVFGVAVLASVFSRYGGYETRPDVRRRDDAGALDRRRSSSASEPSPRSRSRASAASARREAEALARRSQTPPERTPCAAGVAAPSASRPRPLLLL